jgi:histidine triad (HIT) family protein
MANETIFSKIITKEIPADIVYQDDVVTAFRDIATAADVVAEDELALGRMFTVARKLAEQEGLEKGYRLIVNCKEHGGQEVYHLHMHLLGGRALGPMVTR